jgi:DNA mismatch repair protein MutS2
MIYPNDFEQKLEFTKIRELIKNYCLSNSGKQLADGMHFMTDFKAISEALNQTAEFKYIVAFRDNFPVSHFFDTLPYFERTSRPNTWFSPAELYDIVRSLSTLKSIVGFFNNDIENKFPALKALSNGINFFPFVSDRINSVIDKFGEIKSNASPELSKIRSDLSKKQSSVSQIIHKILKREMAAGHVESDAEITVRDNKLLIPVEANNKRKIPGIIFGESATGKTSYIEPIEIVALNNEIKELEIAEANEIRKILIQVTDDLRPYFEELKHSYLFMATIDFIRAKALLAVKIEAEKPVLTPDTKIEFLNARHPLLIVSFQKQNKKVVPSNFSLDEERRIIIISGPNAGGKSVALKTVAVLQYMLQCGCLIPVRELSETGLFNSIFIDIGDEQSIENDLSTYSSHLKNMKFFTENSDAQTLILIDEFGTGTEPMLGGAIAEAVLEDIVNRKAKGIITTHYTNLKHFADENKGVLNAAMLYDSVNMQPLYRMEPGKPGSSFAFEIAEKTGLKKEIIENAKLKVDQNQIDFETALKQTQNEKRKLKKSKRNVRQTELKLSETLERYENELELLLQNKKQILKDAKHQAEDLVSTANKQIEKTILEIKKSNAEKEETKNLRFELNKYITEEKEKHREEEEKITRKIEKLKQRKEKRRTDSKSPEVIKIKEIKPGDFVSIEGLHTIAQVVSIDKKKAVVLSNHMQLTIDKDKLKLSEHIPKKQNTGVINVIRNDENETAGYLSQLDVRGKRAEEAMMAVSRYLDDAIINRNRYLKILHGTGNGILRDVIREYLRTQSIVKNFKDERIEAGGTGITLVELDL